MKINRTAQKTVQSLPDKSSLDAFFQGWLHSLTADSDLSQTGARAILRAAGLLDDALLGDFQRVMSTETGLRLALYDLLTHYHPHLGQVEPRQPTQGIPWELLLLSLFADKNGYDLTQFDVHSPPAAYTPAGMALQATIQYMRTQTQRSATERDRLARQLAYSGESSVPSLDQLSSTGGQVAPAPPHYRTPIPVQYPEYNQEINISTDEAVGESNHTVPLQRGAEIKITPEDLPAAPPPPQPRPQPPRPAPRRQPTPQPPPQSSFARSIRQLFRNEQLKTTRLRIVVQDYPDGPGIYGLQVTVSSKSIKSYVAGTTDRQGRFLCELPVRLTSGLTYDIDVSWPEDLGGRIERKSITINADRTEFTLPFYRRSLL
ncbi:MAG: hypothetical protein QNJ45_14400 [Ardenticatenaceae bacterium]|nr:hypothetical protein [Ardenticatenaceae bacterium]